MTGLERLAREKCPGDMGFETECSLRCAKENADISPRDLSETGICAKCWESELRGKNDAR